MSPSPKPADSSRDGCRKGILIAHGFTIEDMVALVRADLAIATADRVMAGGARSRSGGCGSRKQGGGGSNAFTEIAVGYPMPENENRGPHLRTKYVFIDTQAFRRARFDWDGRSLSKLVQFAKQGHLRLLMTDVTIREVKSQLREMLAEARSALGKHSVIFDQLGVSGSLERVRNEAAALKALDVAFDRFLKGTDAVTVPLALDITSVLDDYFARRPPFSAKKKAEFPDAISIASICRWCEQNHATAYVVSEDGDLRECCSDSGPLFHANSITEIISQATVSQAFHEAL